MKPATTTRIAELAGVSQATVSDVLNDRWRQKRIAPKTHDRVVRIARKLNYRPNRLARSLLNGRSNIMSLLIPAISNVYFPRLAYGVEAEAKRHGFHVLLSHIVSGLEDEVAEIEMLLEQRVDGFILVPRHGMHNREKYRDLIREQIPLVFVNAFFEDIPCSAVVGDDFQGACQVTMHLGRLGHRRIAHIAGNREGMDARMRIAGYRKALAELDLSFNETYLVGAGYSVELGYDNMKQLLGLPEPPTAVFGANDHIALGAIKAILERGLRVPDDIAVAGYGDDLTETWFHKIGLTTARIDAVEMGRQAATILIQEMSDPNRQPQLVKLPATLVVRESCGQTNGKRLEPAVARSQAEDVEGLRDVGSSPVHPSHHGPVGDTTPAGAFTLIELLVVTAIIAILAALLAPALKGARGMARQIQCTSNLRQITTAAFAYANDYNGNLPPYWDGATAWWIVLHDKGYLRYQESPIDGDARPLWGRSVYICPSNPWLYSYRVNYAWNCYVNPPSMSGYSLQVADWPTRERKAMVMDEGATSGADCGYALHQGYPAYRQNATWHNNGGNIAFLDGHVEWRSAQTDKSQLFWP